MRTDIKQSVGRNGRNLPNDVDTVVHLVNMHRRRTGKNPLSLRTRMDEDLIQAIEEYQRNSLRQRPTGRIEAASTDLVCLRLPLGSYVAKEYGDPQGLMMSQVDQTACCACFVQWCLMEAGKARGRGAKAESWKTYGSATSPREGAVTVIFRPPFGDSASGWHVGFYVGGPPDAPVLLGGNQANSVCVSQYYDLTEVHYRWPSA